MGSTGLHGNIRFSAKDRFWQKVQIPATDDGCWVWMGTKMPNGYGHFWNDGKGVGAHRFSYETLSGPIPVGLTLDHLCRNKICVRPDHLEAVSQQENTLRSPIAPAAINARKTHCIHGHALTADNLRAHKSRACRECHRLREEKRRWAVN
jgi:hypothetical protein